MQLWLIRHGETDWNVQRRFQGSSEEPLNENGQKQAKSLAPRLQNMHFDAIYASDLIRVRQTAELALDSRSNQVQFDARLREVDFGNWEGLQWEEIRTRYPDDFARWIADRNENPHGGDTLSDVVERVKNFLQDIRQQHNEDATILLFAHGGSLAILISLLLGTNPLRWWQFHLQNCTLNHLYLYSETNVLSRFNDDHHLPPDSTNTETI